VVRRGDSSITDAAVMAHLAGQVATYKRLSGVRFTDTIPKTASGKILRRHLRALV
jgi:4-coumarate--CoA ligase